MFSVGLTGGIASGKSTVADLFAELGVCIIDADIISHQLTQPGAPASQQIIQHFGDEIIDSDGNLDRHLLADIVFNNHQQRSWLEQLLHPMVAEQIKVQLHDVASDYAILVIPLLVEAQWQDKVDRICVVDVTSEQQKSRLTASRSMPADTIERVLVLQATREQRLHIADDVIDNQGEISKLRAQIKHLDELYRELAAAGGTEDAG